jgi:hypothetical protein
MIIATGSNAHFGHAMLAAPEESIFTAYIETAASLIEQPGKKRRG